MAADANPPIFDTAIHGWRYAFAALSRMPGVLGAAMLMVFALSVVKRWWLPDVESLFLQAEATGELDIGQFFQLSFLFMIVRSFLLTPVVIAMHCFVLLGEVTPYYALRPSQSRFMRFFIFSIVFQLLLQIPVWLMVTSSEASIVLGLFGMLVLSTVLFALVIASIIVSLRLLILFPAIAVDAGGANWRNAIADTKGHTWRVFFIMLLTSIPVLVLAAPLYFLLGWPDGPSLTSGIILSVVQAVAGVLGLCAFAAVASRLFAAFANRLKG